MNLERNFSLRSYNTFGIDAECALFTELHSKEDVLQLLHDKQLEDYQKLVLGGGSNILFTQNFNGLVLKNSLKGIEKVKEDEQYVWIKAMAGEVWHELVLYCIERQLAGIENLSLIPGLAGAAPMQNIGAYGVEINSVFDSLEAIHLATGETQTFREKDCEFGYRESVFKKSLKNQFIIISVTLRLSKKPNFNISYGAIRETLEQMDVQELSIKAISDAVIAIRSSKLPDPKKIGNAGSFFKNPEVPKAVLKQIQSGYPYVPNYPIDSDKVKIPAGWLIEQCGWKGKRVGNTGSHKDQALVLVNYGNATGKEIKELAFSIKDSVKEKFGIELSPEVNIV